MARRATRQVRQANAMLLGAEYLRTFGLFRVEVENDIVNFYRYYDHITMQELPDSVVEYRMRNSNLRR